MTCVCCWIADHEAGTNGSTSVLPLMAAPLDAPVFKSHRASTADPVVAMRYKLSLEMAMVFTMSVHSYLARIGGQSGVFCTSAAASFETAGASSSTSSLTSESFV